MTDENLKEDEVEDSAMPLVEHLTELRDRLLRVVIAVGVFFVICFYFSDNIFNILVVPYQQASGNTEAKFVFTALQEWFFVQLKIGLFGAIFIAFPVIATQVYKFVAPGLYQNERKAFLPFLIATPVLFVLGACLVYFFIMPMATQFFLSLQQEAGDGKIAIENLQAVSSYLGLIMTLILAFGFVFQLPVVLSLLVRAGLIDSAWLVTKRKYAIVISFIVAAVLTPPDPFTQIGLACSTLLLYELSIYAARFIEKKRAQREAEEEAAS